MSGSNRFRIRSKFCPVIGFSDISDDFTCRGVMDAEEAKALFEVGFEYVCTAPENTMLFRKRK